MSTRRALRLFQRLAAPRLHGSGGEGSEEGVDGAFNVGRRDRRVVE
ncbi:MAG: hypothetical protein HN667_07610 [Chloroflexi bacterium]|nr:hypothetical protein [Chloroflexota bacterium]